MKQFIIFFVMVLFFSCQNEGRWYPDAEVKIFKYYEYTPTGGGKGLHITAVIHNTGSTTITTGAVTVKAATDTHEYLQTITINGGIIPGGNIAVSVAITYLDASEQITSDGVTVYDAFFN